MISVYQIPGREDIMENILYPTAGLMVCMEKYDKDCSRLVLKDNIIAGVFHAGFGVDGFDCAITEEA